MTRLTARRVESLKRPGRYSDGFGLHLFVQRSGTRSWVQRLTVGGRRVDRGLGAADVVSLAQAREWALANKLAARRGEDPFGNREHRIPTFRVACAKVEAGGHLKGRGLTTRRSALERYCATILDRRIDQIRRADVIGVLSPVMAAKPATGAKLHGWIRGTLAWGVAREHLELGAALLHRGFFALFMGSFARGCVSPVAISGGTSSRPARTGVFSAASRASSRRRTPSVFSPTGALPSGHSRGVLVRCRGKGGRPAMAVTTGFQGRTFDVPRTCVPCIDPPRRAPCAAADAVFADAKAFLSSSEARQMSESELERELHRRGQELVRKLLQGHRDQRSPKEAAGPAEDTSGVECSEPREHESHAETASGTMQVVGLGCARRGHDGLHRLDAALNLLPERYLVEMRRRVTIATASRAPPRTPWKPPWYSTSSTWQRRRGVRCSSPAHRRACRHLVRDPMGDDRRSAAAGSRSLDAY